MPDVTPPLRNLLLAHTVLDRDAAARETRGMMRSLLTDDATRVLDLVGDRAAVTDHADGSSLVLRRPRPADIERYDNGGVTLYLGQVDGAAAVAVLGEAQEDDAAPASAGPGARLATLRDVGLTLSPSDVAMLTGAVALANWHKNHTHCPRCGTATLPRQAGWVRECPSDGSQHFPRTDPAVIMAIIDDDDRILLARGNRWGGISRSVLAGFVEPGESFEAAVVRETFEESGVRVDDVTYVGNQPWPFPASVMIAFTARARTLELIPQAGEIEEIAWYSRADVEKGLAAGTLRLPGRLSIARALIERWYGDALPDPVDLKERS